VTAKHVIVALLGCATACVGAWLAIHSPPQATTAGILVITLGGQVATGALAHAGWRAPRAPSSTEHTPTGFAARD
jgi:hypothetical protein